MLCKRHIKFGCNRLCKQLRLTTTGCIRIIRASAVSSSNSQNVPPPPSPHPLQYQTSWGTSHASAFSAFHGCTDRGPCPKTKKYMKQVKETFKGPTLCNILQHADSPMFSNDNLCLLPVNKLPRYLFRVLHSSLG